MLGIAFLIILGAHGLIHLLGFAKAFSLAELPQLPQAISRPAGVGWLAAGALMLAAGMMLPLAPRWWWVVGAVAVVVSQAVIVASWSDARFGTLANVVILLGVIWGCAHRGPWSLRAEYERDLAYAMPARPAEILREADLG